MKQIRREKPLEPGVPCEHKGCLNHMTHPCEWCGRIGGSFYKTKKETK